MDDFEFNYSNGADGSCQECGEATEEEWHAYCAACYAEQQGWVRPRQHHDKPPEVEPTIADRRWERLLARMADLERRLARLEDRAAQRAA